VRTEVAGELAHSLDRLIAALAHDVGRAKLARQRNAIGVTAEHDDLLGTEPASGYDTAETHRAITNNRGNHAVTAPIVFTQSMNVIVAKNSVLTLAGPLNGAGVDLNVSGLGTRVRGGLR